MGHPFQCRPQIFTQAIWADGVDTFTIPTRKLEEWNRIYPGIDETKEEFEKVEEIGNLSLVKIDLYQWMQLTSHERTLLLINYCRRPTKGDQGEGSVVMPMADFEIRVKDKHSHGKTDKNITLKKGQKLKIVKWNSADLVQVEAHVDGSLDNVIVNKDAVIEDSKEWSDAVEAMKDYMSTELEEGLLERPLEGAPVPKFVPV